MSTKKEGSTMSGAEHQPLKVMQVSLLIRKKIKDRER